MEPKQKIIVVEDDESQRFLYSEEVLDHGYQPILARNGKEAIEILKHFRPDLILLDIVMPVMDGMETLGKIIGQYKHIPIILFSSYPRYKDDFMSWAADAYLTKSSDLTELMRVVRHLLETTKKGSKVESHSIKKGGDNDETHFEKREGQKGELQLLGHTG